MARITTVDEVRRPVVAVVIDVRNVFTHCAKAFRRGGVWAPDTWVDHVHSPVLAARHRQLDAGGHDVGPLADYVAANADKIEADLTADAPGT